jgi:phospholipase C
MMESCSPPIRWLPTIKVAVIPIPITRSREDAPSSTVARATAGWSRETTALWLDKYLGISSLIGQFYSDCSAGTLPAVSFVEPRFVGSLVGTSNDDHPYADIRAGQAFLNRVYQAVTTSPNWSSTVFIINYDEWGGFFDHVPPPTGSFEASELALGYPSDRLRGFRVPAVLISPFAQRRFVSHDVFDHASILKLIEQRWNLTPLTQRDAQATSLANALFQVKQATATPPQYDVPEVSGAFCSPIIAGGAASRTTGGDGKPWVGLQEMARDYGWKTVSGER